MTASLALTEVAPLVDYDPTKDSRHRGAKAARAVADWLAHLEYEEKAARTLYDYEWAAARLLRYYPSKDLPEIAPADLLHVIRTFPVAGRRTRVYALRSLFQFAVATDLIERDPFDKLPKIKRPKRKHIEVFTDEEVARLEALPGDDGHLWAILFGTGIRRKEARELQRRDISRRQLIVRYGKGGKPREIDYMVGLDERLQAWFESEQFKPTDHLWPTRPGGYYLDRREPMGNTSFGTWYSRGIAAAEVTYRKPHTTRHTYATRWLRRGGRLETLSEQLGHESIKTTYDEYAHLDRRDVLRDLHVIEGGAAAK